jgi:hypothetical protein
MASGNPGRQPTNREGAVVAMVTTTLEGVNAAASSVVEPGDVVQVDSNGIPLHVTVTVSPAPPAGVTLTE